MCVPKGVAFTIHKYSRDNKNYFITIVIIVYAVHTRHNNAEIIFISWQIETVQISTNKYIEDNVYIRSIRTPNENVEETRKSEGEKCVNALHCAITFPFHLNLYEIVKSSLDAWCIPNDTKNVWIISIF